MNMENSNVKHVYINENTVELRAWLRSIDMLPIDYPECDERRGLIAPYHVRPGISGEGKKWIMYYKDGEVFETDDDANEYYFCETEDEFQKRVIELKNLFI